MEREIEAGMRVRESLEHEEEKRNDIHKQGIQYRVQKSQPRRAAAGQCGEVGNGIEGGREGGRKESA